MLCHTGKVRALCEANHRDLQSEANDMTMFSLHRSTGIAQGMGDINIGSKTTVNTLYMDMLQCFGCRGTGTPHALYTSNT